MCCRGASSGGRAWRHMPANCIPRRPAHSNVCSQCALGRSATARCPRNAFPSAWRWRYVDVMRSWVSDDGNILPRCIPKRPRTGKGALRGNISPPCIQNELALARYARHASEKPCKSLLEDTPREYLARKGHFSLHGPSNHARRADLATIQRSQGLANGRQEELGIASALRIAADGPTTVVAYVCGSRARSR